MKRFIGFIFLAAILVFASCSNPAAPQRSIPDPTYDYTIIIESTADSTQAEVIMFYENDDNPIYRVEGMTINEGLPGTKVIVFENVPYDQVWTRFYFNGSDQVEGGFPEFPGCWSYNVQLTKDALNAKITHWGKYYEENTVEVF